MTDLKTRHCTPCEGGTKPLTSDEANRLLNELDSSWQMADNNSVIEREFEFRNYYHISAFVNAVIWIAHREDHHPDITFGYKTCTVRYSTHAIGGLSDNDFICAARIDALLEST